MASDRRGISRVYFGREECILEMMASGQWYGRRAGVVVSALVTFLLGTVGAAAQPPDVTVEYYHLDAVGSVRAVTDATGAVVRRYDYRPFGEGDGVSAGADPLRFTGKERDAETGLDYFGARHYAQRTGRFTTVDPVQTTSDNLADPQRWNRYAYVRNNPLRFSDPDGRCIYPGADCLQYLAGMAKAVGNVVPDTASLVNRGVNLIIGPLTDFRFGDAPRFAAANEDQSRGMFAAQLAMLMSPLVEFGASSAAARLPNLGNKLEYVFGNATGTAHNIERSQTMFGQLERIGLRDSPEARRYFTDLLQQAYQQPGILQSNGRILRDFLVMGPNGALRAETIWEGDDLITVFLYGGGS